MNCQDMEKFIHVYLDREFAEEDRADFEQHLAECEHCRRLAQFERTFKQQLKVGLQRPHLPLEQREELRGRIMAAIDNAPPVSAAGRLWKWTVGVGSAVAAALLVVTVIDERSEQRPHLRASLEFPALLHRLKAHEASLELRSADREAVRRWYQERLGIAVEPPRFSDGRTALVGAQIRQVNQQQAAQLVYERGGRQFQVTIIRPDQVPQGGQERRIGDRSVYFSSYGGQNVAVFQHQGVGYTIQAPADARDLDTLVRELLTPVTGPPPQ
jgi:anti-sigma factor (TIGR02949 family)